MKRSSIYLACSNPTLPSTSTNAMPNTKMYTGQRNNKITLTLISRFNFVEIDIHSISKQIFK